jgi:hypothetical protein
MPRGRSTKASKPSCRYCLETKATQENYLFAPCACKGSVEYVHFVCFMRWFFTCDPQTRMICPICKTYYTNSPLDTLEKVSIAPPLPIHLYGSPVTSIIVFHYLFGMLGTFTLQSSFPIAQAYFYGVLCYQAIFFAYLLKYTWPQDPWRYVRAYVIRKNWGLPVCQLATLCFLGYDPRQFFIAGVCANALLTFYWQLHVETIYECNAIQLEDLAIRLTLLDS